MLKFLSREQNNAKEMLLLKNSGSKNLSEFQGPLKDINGHIGGGKSGSGSGGSGNSGGGSGGRFTQAIFVSYIQALLI